MGSDPYRSGHQPPSRVWLFTPHPTPISSANQERRQAQAILRTKHTPNLGCNTSGVRSRRRRRRRAPQLSLLQPRSLSIGTCSSIHTSIPGLRVRCRSPRIPSFPGPRSTIRIGSTPVQLGAWSSSFTQQLPITASPEVCQGALCTHRRVGPPSRGGRSPTSGPIFPNSSILSFYPCIRPRRPFHSY